MPAFSALWLRGTTSVKYLLVKLVSHLEVNSDNVCIGSFGHFSGLRKASCYRFALQSPPLLILRWRWRVSTLKFSRESSNFFSFFYNCIVSMGFLQGKSVVLPAESQLQQSRVTQPWVHAGCLSVSIIHRTLTWTTGSSVCAQMLMHAVAHGKTIPKSDTPVWTQIQVWLGYRVRSDLGVILDLTWV